MIQTPETRKNCTQWNSSNPRAGRSDGKPVRRPEEGWTPEAFSNTNCVVLTPVMKNNIKVIYLFCASVSEVWKQTQLISQEAWDVKWLPRLFEHIQSWPIIYCYYQSVSFPLKCILPDDPFSSLRAFILLIPVYCTSLSWSNLYQTYINLQSLFTDLVWWCWAWHQAADIRVCLDTGTYTYPFAVYPSLNLCSFAGKWVPQTNQQLMV